MGVFVYNSRIELDRMAVMSRTESEFWKNHLRTGFRKSGVRFQRFEDSLSEGIPDLCVFINGKTIWIELKNKRLPVRKTTKIKVGLRPLQRVWQLKRRKDGIPVFTLTRFLRGEDLEYYTLHDSSVVDELYYGETESVLKSIGIVLHSIDDIVSCLHKGCLREGLNDG